MSNGEFFIQSSKMTYIQLPKVMKGDISEVLKISKKLQGKYLKVRVDTDDENDNYDRFRCNNNESLTGEVLDYLTRHDEELRSFFIHPDVLTYIKLPEVMKQDIMIALKVPKELEGKILKVRIVFDYETDFPVRHHCTEEQCEKCGVQDCMVHFGAAILYDYDVPAEEKPDTRPIIPGHPNCRYGDCDNCGVVSCSIHQGWMPLPEMPK